MKKNEHFLEFLKISWFGVRICNFESKFSFFFFICNFIFFSIFLCFDGFPLFFIVFHGFPGFQVPRARKMKNKWKKMKTKWKFPRVFEDFLVRSENLQLWVQIFIFFSFATSFFFHFPLCLMVFHCFSLFFMAFLEFRCHGQGKWKNNGKKHDKKMKISSSFWRFPGSEWESATLSPNFHFFFHLQLHFFIIFLCFWWFSIVFHGFPGFQVPGARKMKKKWKKWKQMKKTWNKNENVFEFLKISWFGVRICNFESKFSCFFHLQLHVFSFSFVFDGFPLFFIVFHGFPGFQVPRARKMKKKWKKNMKISSSFWRFPGSEWESATLSPNFHFLFICNFMFFSFSFVFDGFPLFFMAFLDFRCHGQGKWKKHDKKMIKQWKNNEQFPRVFEDFLVRSENLQLWVQIFIFFHLQLHMFFIFLCFWWFSIVFHGFPGFQVPRERKMKNMIKKWSLKWKKNEVWNEKKWCLKWNKWSLEKQKTKKWKINENKKMIEKQNEKNEVTNENPNEK